MNELYWITRLNSIVAITSILLFISSVLTLIFTVVYFTSNGQVIYDRAHGYECHAKEQEGYRETCKKGLKYSIPITVIFALIFIFVPSTKEAFLIYGVGGTVDYLKTNPTARQLPDKCIKSLDKWVDSWSGEKSDSTNKK